MRIFISHFLLFCFCCTMFFQICSNNIAIIAMLCSLFVLSLSYFFNQTNVSLLLFALYAVLALFQKEFVIFFPMLTFSITYNKCFVPLPLLAIGILYQFHADSPLLFLSLLQNGTAFWIAILIRKLEGLQQQYFSLRDDTTEHDILLRERNQTLLKNQNYEIHNATLQERNQTLLKNQNYEIHNATLQERNRIAREIHDNVGHMLTRAILLLGAVKTINQDQKITDSLTLLEDTLTQTMDNIRSSVHNLHDNSIDLQKSLHSLIQNYTFCKVNLKYDIESELPANIRYTFLSIVKEALTNTAKHSNATRIDISLREHPAFYQLITQDNGSSENVQKWADHTSGIGMINIQERVQNANGMIQITARNGFRIFISIPKKEEKNDTDRDRR